MKNKIKRTEENDIIKNENLKRVKKSKIDNNNIRNKEDKVIKSDNLNKINEKSKAGTSIIISKSCSNLKNVLLTVKTRKDFREWLTKNHDIEPECWIIINRKKPKKENLKSESIVLYLDAVEEALCFGWIDSTLKSVEGIGCLQRFSPRRKISSWTELNKERCRRLEKLGLMTSSGRDVLPDMTEKGFIISNDILKKLKKNPETWKNFQNFPPLYQRVRIDNIQKIKNNNKLYESRLKKFIENTEKNIIFGNWNDYGRLINY